jgi:hypothetical protein
MSSVVVNPATIITINLLSVGFMTDWERWTDLARNATIRQYAKELNPKLIRVFDFRTAIRPCTNWNSGTSTGTWNWANIDEFTAAVFDIGAEPLFTLAWPGLYTATTFPPGMTILSATGLPAPADFAAYAREWVRHFKQTGKPVRFYEIFNEPDGYFWNGIHTFNENLGFCITVWQATAAAMRSENPSVLLSHDQTETMSVLQYWIANGGPEIDSINFHKYDSEELPGRTDADIFNRAESQHYAVAVNAQSYYRTQRGRILPILDTESNLSWAWETGTDPRIQQMSGGVWLALSLHAAMLAGVSYNTYFELTSDKTVEQNKNPNSWGFGMIDNTPPTRWIPYYVYLMFGKNLFVDDQIVETSTSDTSLRVVAWTHGNILNILLINKSHTNKQVAISGISGNLDYTKLDESTNADNPVPQTGVYSSSNIPLNGYTVILLQTSALEKFFFSHWGNDVGDTNPTKTVTV